ncbi:hypothetical protein K2173_004066 [Erythroxylum novogranatense]|uniref:RPM1 interacting protein 13 n=1 Tax=Erythroxylum novogranatense TaxID=1862640 RepID=A0AAV8SKK8_9ROSI|nr:hypothetical protein K2173_004066 [Erythroxylum novogranatense]
MAEIVVEIEEEEQEEGSSSRPVPVPDKFVPKNGADMKSEDCFMIDFDPHSISVPLTLPKLTVSDYSDLSIIDEKGQVACRDFPHSRHHCVKFPFDSTPHENFCEQCYCYVCDSAAPCKFWTANYHCDASEYIGGWTSQRELQRKSRKE